MANHQLPKSVFVFPRLRFGDGFRIEQFRIGTLEFFPDEDDAWQTALGVGCNRLSAGWFGRLRESV